MDFKEVETKYYANSVSMEEFVDLVKTLDPEWVMVSSYDDYFINEAGDFIRYRYHDHMGELTIKRKTDVANNFNRIEVNLKTEGKSSKNVEAFLSLLGYKRNFSIFKTCKIAVLEKIILVYYIVYDVNLNEIDRFIEIEANEHYAWNGDEQAAMKEVERYEMFLKPLGISSRKRLKKSLFELFKK